MWLVYEVVAYVCVVCVCGPVCRCLQVAVSVGAVPSSGSECRCLQVAVGRRLQVAVSDGGFKWQWSVPSSGGE